MAARQRQMSEALADFRRISAQMQVGSVRRFHRLDRRLKAAEGVLETGECQSADDVRAKVAYLLATARLDAALISITALTTLQAGINRFLPPPVP